MKRLIMKNKKSQFYIFTAVMLCTYLFALASAISQKVEESNKFEIIKENFAKESPIVINSATYNKLDVSEQFRQFTQDFINYAKTKGSDLEILYLLVKDNIEINNYLNTEVKINNNSLNRGENLIVNKTDQVTVEAYNNDYNFDISNEPLQLKALLRARENNNIQVYLLKK